MKRLLGILAVIVNLVAAPSWATITEVASQRATSAACNAVDSCALAFPNNVTAGNLIVGGGNYDDNTTTPTFTVTDTVGTTYSVIVCTPNLNNGTDRSNAWLFYGIAAGSGANTVTVNPDFDTAHTQLHFAIDEFTGVADPPLDVDGGSSTGTSTTPADSLTTLIANDLVLGVVGMYTGGTISVGSGYTQIGEDQSALDAFNLEFQIVTTAQAYSVNWTLGTSQEWHACTAAFKSAGSVRRPIAPMVFQ